MSPPYTALPDQAAASARFAQGTQVEMRVRLAEPDALYGVLAVLHARRVQVHQLHLDGHLLRVGITRAGPQLLGQIARRVDVVDVALIPARPDNLCKDLYTSP